MTEVSPRNRRKEDRFSSIKRVKVYGVAEVPVMAQLSDCSAHGVGLILTRPLNVDAQFLLRLKNNRQLIAYTVRSCVRVAEGEYRIGAQLTGMVHEPVQNEADLILQLLLEPD